MTTNRLRRRLAAAAAAATLATTAVGIGSAAAEDSPPPVEARLERACLRIPNLQIRTTNVLQRIQGDPSTVGSLLWLDTQIDNAREKGRDQLAEVLSNRRAVRESTIAVLDARRATLDDLASICAEYGYGQ